MEETRIPPLTVYKASAGSGKTFTLASEYIKLLVQNPQQYRNILAVTFTNKATEEMKMRILSQLYGIWKRLSDSEDYLKHICQLTGYDEKLVRERAGIALQNLLHHYNYFRVSTIDTFFQSVLRNLARELDLTANLRIELNDQQVEEQAVDELIQDLQTTDLLLQWILRYVMDNIDENQSWNVIGSIKKFGTTIFKDFYKEHSEALNSKMAEKDFFERFTQQLNSQRTEAVGRMKDIGVSFTDTLAGEGLTPEDLNSGKNIVSFFLKLQNGVFDDSVVNKTVEKYSQDASCWWRKGDEAQLRGIVEEVLMPILAYAVEERKKEWNRYQSATLTLMHLNQLRLLGEIEHKVRSLNQEANRFLLSDTQHLLNRLIANSDSPFIFEKIGAQLEHIMIDEFQDTSTVQWANFKVLLEECMSHEQSQNLIVGDVKQSIYRWRSGDWRLFNNIEKQFSHPGQQLRQLPLDTNHRSQRNIINFNNAFFLLAAKKEEASIAEKTDAETAKQVAKAYEDVSQKIPAKREAAGYVSVTLFPAEDYKQQVLNATSQAVSRLIEAGARQNQMAILVRTKDVIPDIIEHFAQVMPEVSIVSDEAFRLDASRAVNSLIDGLRLLVHPDDLVTRATLTKQLGALPEGFLDKADQLLRLPLYELTQQLFGLFRLEQMTDEHAYVFTFYDYLNSYIADNASDLEAFLSYWDETLHKKTIQVDEVNGIRMLTIHKSKGLEYEHVILPFCDWVLERSRDNIIWCEADREPYNELPLVPVDYSGKMMGTTYEKPYLDEYLQNRVDNLNLLYVAFTRARSNLFVFGKRNNSRLRSKLIEDVLPELDGQLNGIQLTGQDDKKAILSLEYGTLCIENKKEKRSKNVFLQPSEGCEVLLRAYTNKTSFRQSNKSQDFIEGEDEEQPASYIKIGSVLHDVFAHIRTTEDIDRVILQMQMDGVLYNNDVTQDRLIHMIRKRLEDPRVSDWFSPRWKLFNECTILTQEDGRVVERRPDRVMTCNGETIVVDFKFGKPQAEYHDQVREYMTLLQGMGHHDTRGFLWYVYSNKIEEVSL